MNKNRFHFMFHEYRTKEAKNLKKALKSKIVPVWFQIRVHIRKDDNIHVAKNIYWYQQFWKFGIK